MGDFKSQRIKPKVSSAQLTAEEGFLLSRLGSGVTFKELLTLCPWDEEKISDILKSLVTKQALETEGSQETSQNPLHAQLQADEVDADLKSIDRDFRREVLLKLQSIDQQNPYQILDLAHNASTHEIKVQYHAVSKKFHPDRFFRKNLGHYKAKLDLIFGKIQKAYALLKDPQQREVFDRMREIKNSNKVKSKEERLKAIRNLDPQLERIGLAEKYFKDGKQAAEKQEYIAAFNSFTLALQYVPDKDLYKKELESVRPLMVRQRAEQKVKESERAFEMKIYDECMLAAEEALQLQSDLPIAQILWAKAVMIQSDESKFKAARERLLRAKAGLPKSPEPCFLLGKLSSMQGDTKTAKKELQEALSRDPKFMPAKNLLQDL